MAPALCELVSPTPAYAASEELGDELTPKDSTDQNPGAINVTDKDADDVSPESDTTVDEAQQADDEDETVLTAQDSTDEPDAWLDDEGHDDVFSNDTLSLWVRWNRPIENPYKLYVNVGPWDKMPGEEGFRWEDGFQEGDAYTFDEQTGELCLNGAWLFENGYDHVWIFVGVGYKPEGQEEEQLLEGGDARRIDVREASVDYDRERDRDLLPGWDGSVNDSYSVWVEDADHPDGEGIDYRVTDVEVVSGAEYLSDFHEDSDDENRWWYYRAGNRYGTATLKVTYEIPEELGGGTDSYTFKLNVSADVYDVRVWWDEEYGDSILPGTTVDLYAQGTHRRYEQDDTDEGLTYEWKLLEGDEAGTLAADPDDPQHATFTAATPSADKMGFDDFVHVRVYLYDGGEDPVADSGWAFNVRNTFCELFPTSIGDLGVGQSVDVPFELRSYLWDADPDAESYTTVDGARLSFWYDPDCLTIADADGNEVVDNGQRDGDNEASYPVGTFTITRLGDWDTAINVRAVWEDHGDRREAWANLRLDRLDYHMWFEGDHDLDAWVTREEDGGFTNPSNPSKALELSDSLADLDGLAIEWTVGTWDHDDYQQTFGPESGLYSVSDDGRTITADAAAMAEQGFHDLRVVAVAKVGGHEVAESDGDFWFHLGEREYDYSFPCNAWMLPGWRWDGWIESHAEVFVNDENHDCEHLDVAITNVSIDNENVATIEKSGDSWTIEAINYGDATVTITYTDIDGTEGCTWDVPVAVSRDVYNVNVTVTAGDTCALPGETIPLAANGWHDFIDNEGRHQSTTEGLTYEWRIFGDGQNVATIEPSADGKSATVTLGERPDDVDRWERDIWVRVLIFDEDAHGQQQVAEGGISLMVSDGYYVITPYEPDFLSDTAVGDTFTISPKLLLRTTGHGEGNTTDDITNAEFEICYDPRAIRVAGATVTEENGDSVGRLRINGGEAFEITRLRNWGTGIYVSAFWTDGKGDSSDTSRLYRLNDLPHDCEGTLTRVAAKAPTLNAEGNTEHWKCSTCGRLFLDEEGRDEVAREVVAVPRLIDIAKASVSGVANKAYNGGAFTQTPVVKMGNTTLVQGTDYKVSGTTKATNAGSYTITITGTGIYGGTKSVSYKISPASIAKATVTGIANRTYNGKAQTQAPTVKVGTRTLKSGTDYALSYKANTNAGTATVTVTGRGNYAGTVSKTFKIAPASISGATVSSIAEQGYTGSAIKPTPTVKVGSTTLKKDTDYTLSYKSNTKVGTATVTVTGKGNYTGTKSATFKIVNWAGASRIPVSATAKHTLLKGGYMRVLVSGKKATSDSVVSISGATITGKKAGKTTVYLFDSKGKQIAKKTVEVYTIHNKYFEMESSVDRNYVLDIQGGSTKDGAQMIVYKRKTSGNTDNQKYRYLLQSDGTYRIDSKKSGRCLTVDSKSNKYVQQWAWKGTKAQRWRLTVDSSNRVTFVNVATNKCFDVQGGKTTNSAKMIVWQYNGGLNQKWKLNQK